MRRRMRTRWTLVSADGTRWQGDCPQWAAQPVPTGATLIRERVLWLGPAWSCGCPQHA